LYGLEICSIAMSPTLWNAGTVVSGWVSVSYWEDLDDGWRQVVIEFFADPAFGWLMPERPGTVT
jgi:hypothetical protein